MSSLTAAERNRLLRELPDNDVLELEYDWGYWARPNQLPPQGKWSVWLIMAGRGFGKNRTGAEWVRSQVESGRAGRVALVAPTAADSREVMVEGPAGVLTLAPPWFRPFYEPSKRRLTWPNGATATTFSADEPDRLRGPQHDAAFADELATWPHPETWHNLMMGLRLGQEPRCVVTTTPRRVPLLRELIKTPSVHLTRGSTYENLENLAPTFRDRILARYENTRLGRQELMGELLEDVPGALWTYGRFEPRQPAPDMSRIVVAIDPSGGSDPENDEQGIGAAGKGVDGRGYVLADRTCKLSPDGWARRAIQLYLSLQADLIVYERNFGGDMVEAVLETAARSMGVVVKTKAVTASRGKRVRAEPIAALYEQGKISHVPDEDFDALIDECCTWTPESGTSPNRLDWLVWALTELFEGGVTSFW